MLLLDNSAWSRINTLSQRRANQIADLFEAGEIAVSLPFLLEAGYSARGKHDHANLIDELLALPQLSITSEVEARAIDAQRQLAKTGHHRLPPVDLLIAAIADFYGVGVLHYDPDYDLIAKRTNLKFHSEWIARRGSID